jgi:hypothetical protein
MTTWYSKALGDGVQAGAPLDQIQKAFLPLFANAGQPVDMAVFSRYDLKANVVTVYFSPGASQLATMFNATSCQKPSDDGIGLLVGDHGCWQLFFPGRHRTRN